PLRDHGLSASEARMTIPFEDDDPAGVLDVAGNFYEFIPEEEYGKPSPRVLRAWELDPGANYYIILTTPGGLIRYDIADVVRCDGNYLGVPRLAFLHKGSHIANMTGEKLTAHHAARAVAAVQEAYGVTLGHSVLTPDPGPLPGY